MIDLRHNIKTRPLSALTALEQLLGRKIWQHSRTTVLRETSWFSSPRLKSGEKVNNGDHGSLSKKNLTTAWQGLDTHAFTLYFIYELIKQTCNINKKSLSLLKNNCCFKCCLLEHLS